MHVLTSRFMSMNDFSTFFIKFNVKNTSKPAKIRNKMLFLIIKSTTFLENFMFSQEEHVRHLYFEYYDIILFLWTILSEGIWPVLDMMSFEKIVVDHSLIIKICLDIDLFKNSNFSREETYAVLSIRVMLVVYVFMHNFKSIKT